VPISYFRHEVDDLSIVGEEFKSKDEVESIDEAIKLVGQVAADIKRRDSCLGVEHEVRHILLYDSAIVIEVGMMRLIITFRARGAKNPLK
jgi:hypothetical protein